MGLISFGHEAVNSCIGSGLFGETVLGIKLYFGRDKGITVVTVKKGSLGIKVGKIVL